MQRFSWFLVAGILVVSGAQAQQKQPAFPFDSVQTALMAARANRPQFYLGAQANLAAHWPALNARMVPWWGGSLGAFIGMKLNTNWAAQLGGNLENFSGGSSLYQPTPTGGPMPYASSAQYSGQVQALPLAVRYHPAWRLGLDASLEAFAGLMPQWQRLTTTTVVGGPNYTYTETTAQERSFALSASVGVAAVAHAGAGFDVVMEAALSQRLYSTTSTDVSVANVPSLGIGARFRFGGLPHRGSYLRN